MTEEELKSIDQTTELIDKHGFVIKDTASFISAVGDANLEEVLNRLDTLEVSINEGVNAEVFGKDIASSFDEIEEIVNSDTYFRTSPEAAGFINLLNDLRDKSMRLSRNTLMAEEIVKGREENLKDIQNRIFKLKVNKDISDKERTSETVKLYYALNHAKKAYVDSLNFYNEQKELSEKPMNAKDYVDFKNELLGAINALDNSSRKLSMNPDNMEKLALFIRNARDKIVLFGFDTQKNQEEFDKICAKFGLGKAKDRVISKEVEEPKIDIPEEIEVHEETKTFDEPLDYITREEPKEEIKENLSLENVELVDERKEITTVKELIDEVVKLNENAEVIRDGASLALLVDDPEKLILPDGFNYDESLGINNKKDDFSPYICAFVKEKAKNLGTVTSDDLLENEPVLNEIHEEPQREVNNEDSNLNIEPEVEEASRVPSGRLSYKRTRRAIVAPYVKAILCYGALGGLIAASAGIGLSAVGVGLITGAGVGVVGQKIYHKLIDAGVLDVPKGLLGNPNYELPVFGSHIVSDAKSLLESLRKYKKRIEEETLDESIEPVEEENLDLDNEPEQLVEEQALSTEVKKDELYENFKDAFSSNLNNELGLLDNNSFPNINPEQYLLDENEDLSLGGRR